ncbi:hypothetical protein KEM60_01428 [Austwickia sp. TVS 96-490-7B]|uniref:hypothetical protein n=1 Tax=Austwickia sp. TVS 96-490-7B TaxID=2830843 RepID=UPI001C57B667|nr:hypothetical protein [Austwickia sp. TVS 96-490-7B]MBW3085231.1 hypothetical protein [Austwickia sp. TVS 96-490-7B]
MRPFARHIGLGAMWVVAVLMAAVIVLEEAHTEEITTTQVHQGRGWSAVRVNQREVQEFASALGVDEERLLSELEYAGTRANAVAAEKREDVLIVTLAERFQMPVAKVREVVTQNPRIKRFTVREVLAARLHRGVDNGRISEAQRVAILRAFDSGQLSTEMVEKMAPDNGGASPVPAMMSSTKSAATTDVHPPSPAAVPTPIPAPVPPIPTVPVSPPVVSPPPVTVVSPPTAPAVPTPPAAVTPAPSPSPAPTSTPAASTPTPAVPQPSGAASAEAPAASAPTDSAPHPDGAEPSPGIPAPSPTR